MTPAPLKLLVIGLSLTLTACGFHLRGAPQFPDDARTVFVESSNLYLLDEISAYLADGGASVARTRDEAEAVLDLSKETFTRRTLSVDPETGKEREFEISYSLSFEFRKTDGTVLVKRQTINLIRDYVFDVDQVIGKSREQDVLRDEMRRDAVQQILTRLGSALQKS